VQLCHKGFENDLIVRVEDVLARAWTELLCSGRGAVDLQVGIAGEREGAADQLRTAPSCVDAAGEFEIAFRDVNRPGQTLSCAKSLKTKGA
jgi:hypothetical protein